MLSLKLRLLKRCDRLLGRWLCQRFRPHARALSEPPPAGAPAPWQARPVAPSGIQRILVIRPGGIGDAVLTFPMLRVLRSHFREACIDALGEGRNAGVYRINDWVRDVYRYDDWRFPSTLARLRRNAYDIVVDTEQYHFLSCVVADRLRPRYLCGFDTLGRGHFQTHRVRYSEQVYEVLSFLNLAAALCGDKPEFDRDRPFLEVGPAWQEWAARTLGDHGERPAAVIVPGASTPHKYWPPARYAEIARWLAERGYLVVLLGGPDTVGMARLIRTGLDRRHWLDLTGQTSLAQTAGLVQRARLYLSSDTGALHIAYGVGTPTVHMFGSGIMEKWAPPGRHYVVVCKDLPCSPCTRYGYTPPCPYGVACMEAITVGDVRAAIEEVLRR
ncbi:MAG: glycosyltransferase family 9 protein [Phycisphaerae bacterium]|jgi:ADP-heptose:LPS heptosyltransferase